MIKMGQIGGEPSTFCTALIWDEAAFDYMRIIDCARHRDARAEYLAMHAPPLWIIVSVRYAGEVIKP
jgi:hypothetical protein